MYLFGTLLVPSDSATASETEVNALLQSAWRARREWPECLVLPDAAPHLGSFAELARREEIRVEVVPQSALAVYINDVQAAFREHFGGTKRAPPNPAFNRTLSGGVLRRRRRRRLT